MDEEPVTAERADDAADDELAQLRELVTRAHPDAVAELIQGASLAELLAAVPAARAAYARVAEAARDGAPGPVPAGGAVRSPEARAESLSPLGKIRVGLTQRGR